MSFPSFIIAYTFVIMKDKFITNTGIEIPLHNVSYTFTEENPRFKDSFWTNYTLPIDYHYDREIVSKLGHFSSLYANGLQRFHEGVHIFEGKRLKGKLEILEFNNEKLKFQIDSGFENLPNFETKLEDLPLLDFEVEDIYQHANQIVEKKYPEVAYNFPKLYTDKYNLEDEGWKYFDSMLNHRTREGQGKAFPRNRIENGMDVYNKNIIHPMPYLLYVLKAGFQDAGFQLEGDILNDKTLMQRCIYSGKEYFTTADQKPHKIKIFDTEYYDHGGEKGRRFVSYGNGIERDVTIGRFTKSVKIPAPGRYRVKINLSTSQQAAGENRIYLGSTLRILKNKTELKSYVSGNSMDIKDNSLTMDITEEEAIQGVDLVFEYHGIVANDQKDEEKKVIGVAQFEIKPMRQHTKDGAVIPYVFNYNKVNLKRSMPDMSFGELVTTIKNWRNYDLEFSGSRAIMNLIKVDKSKEAEDFRQFEISNPLRRFTDKTSFNIKFPDAESVETKNIFIDEKGYELNKAKLPSNITEISINAFCLKLTNFRGQYTAKSEEESALMLVYYDGLNQEGDNHATNPAGLEGEHCAIHLLPWFKNRLTNFSYKWSFITEKNKIRSFNIRSEIFCYDRRHLIKSWVKKSLNERFYSIEMETETY